MKSYSRNAGIVLLLALFLLAKLHDLSLPYFWDELGVYAPGALNMKDTGHFGLLPSCMDPELSRGHPLLSYLGYALAYRCFGDATTTGHAFTLLLAVAALRATYGLARTAFSRAASLALCPLLALQPLFFAMAGIVMPEMMLTLFTVLALWAVLQGRWLTYAATGICCVLIKEAGIAVPAAALAFTGMEAIRARSLLTFRTAWQLLVCLLPLLVFACFLLIQRQLLGWYLFPLHQHLIRHDPAAIWRSAVRITHFVFLAQGRWVIFIFLCAGTVAACLRPVRDAARSRLLLLSGLFLLAALGFAAPNYHLVRYSLYMLPFSLLIAVWGLDRLAALLPNRYYLAVVGAGCVAGSIIALLNLWPHQFADNADMSYRFFVQTEKQCINWAERQPWKDSVLTANFPVYQALTDRRNGYLQTRSSWKAIPSEPGVQTTRYGIYYWQGGKKPALAHGRFYELRRFRQYDAVFSVMMRAD